MEQALALLDAGEARVAEPTNSGWIVHQWLKKAVLLSFRLNDSRLMEGAGGAPVYDKVGMKFGGWDAARFAEAGFRAVPGAVVRHSAYLASGVVVMPSFVNVGAYVDRNTMVDTWVTVGSCAQIGRNCHLSGGVGIGGVLEPLQANPVIIEDDCFISAPAPKWWKASSSSAARCCRWACSSARPPRSSIARPARCSSAGCPPYSVVVPGSLPGRALPDGSPGPSLYCAVIVKRVDERTRAKTLDQRIAARLSASR